MKKFLIRTKLRSESDTELDKIIDKMSTWTFDVYDQFTLWDVSLQDSFKKLVDDSDTKLVEKSLQVKT